MSVKPWHLSGNWPYYALIPQSQDGLVPDYFKVRIAHVAQKKLDSSVEI